MVTLNAFLKNIKDYVMKHDILFSILAAQNGLITEKELVEIGSAWVANPSRGLKDRIIEKIGEEEIETLEKMVLIALMKHAEDTEIKKKSEHFIDQDFKTLGGHIRKSADKYDEADKRLTRFDSQLSQITVEESNEQIPNIK